jgi:hypothetical protein
MASVGDRMAILEEGVPGEVAAAAGGEAKDEAAGGEAKDDAAGAGGLRAAASSFFTLTVMLILDPKLDIDWSSLLSLVPPSFHINMSACTASQA